MPWDLSLPVDLSREDDPPDGERTKRGFVVPRAGALALPVFECQSASFWKWRVKGDLRPVGNISWVPADVLVSIGRGRGKPLIASRAAHRSGYAGRSHSTTRRPGHGRGKRRGAVRGPWRRSVGRCRRAGWRPRYHHGSGCLRLPSLSQSLLSHLACGLVSISFAKL